MLAVGGERVIAKAYLKQYSTPPPLLHIELTPGGARYQLLLFADLSAVRSFKRLPSSAFLVDGGGPNGDLSTGDSHDSGYSRSYGPDLPANFRQYRYFTITKARGSSAWCAADSGGRCRRARASARLPRL